VTRQALSNGGRRDIPGGGLHLENAHFVGDRYIPGRAGHRGFREAPMISVSPEAVITSTLDPSGSAMWTSGRIHRTRTRGYDESRP